MTHTPSSSLTAAQTPCIRSGFDEGGEGARDNDGAGHQQQELPPAAGNSWRHPDQHHAEADHHPEHRDAPELRRLAPPAHPHDPEAEAQYRSLVGEGLWKSRDDALDLLEASLSERHLDAAQLEAWMRAVNDVRLVLGTMLDVGPHGPEALPPGHPMAGHFDVYQWLTVLQEYLVLGLMGKS